MRYEKNSPFKIGKYARMPLTSQKQTIEQPLVVSFSDFYDDRGVGILTRYLRLIIN